MQKEEKNISRQLGGKDISKIAFANISRGKAIDLGYLVIWEFD